MLATRTAMTNNATAKAATPQTEPLALPRIVISSMKVGTPVIRKAGCDPVSFLPRVKYLLQWPFASAKAPRFLHDATCGHVCTTWRMTIQ